ncbi:hypothetical protein D3C83_154710 [compost metagenome]
MIERSAAASITNVLVIASGRKRRPACPVSPKTGTNETAMMSSEKKIAGVTSLAARARRARLASAERPGGACSSAL